MPELVSAFVVVVEQYPIPGSAAIHVDVPRPRVESGDRLPEDLALRTRLAAPDPSRWVERVGQRALDRLDRERQAREWLRRFLMERSRTRRRAAGRLFLRGSDLIDIAARHIGESYHLGVLVPKNNSGWRGPWDCAEFASWCVYQVAGTLYGCDNDHGNPATADAYTGYWQSDAHRLGQIISIDLAAQTAGAAVLRFPQPKLTGHIVFSDGNGGTVEAHSTATGVIRSTLSGRRWDVAILVPAIAYEQSGAPTVVAAPLLTLRLTSPLMRGDVVRAVQEALARQSIDPGTVDGLYGAQTAAAVNAFQIAHGLVPDGEVGTETAEALGVTLPA